MTKNHKSRMFVLLQNKFKLFSYITICVALFIGLIITPIILWMYSGIENRGITSVRGSSMDPTIVNNAILYVQPTKFERGEIVVAKCPENDNYTSVKNVALLKRIVGLPGEIVEITADGVLIDGQLFHEEYTLNQDKTLLETNDITEIILSDNEYFLLGDNREESFDSRNVGAFHSSQFLYGLTLEPNDYTFKLIKDAVFMFAVHLVVMFVSFHVILVLFTKSSYKANQSLKNTHKDTAKTATKHLNRNNANIQHDVKKAPQQKSKKNQRKIKKEQQKQKIKDAEEYKQKHRKK